MPGQPIPPPPLDTLETRLVRIERDLEQIMDRLDALADGWGKRLNDVRLRYDGQHDRLEARIAAVEKIIT